MRRVKHLRVGVWDLYEEVNPLPRPACHTATRLMCCRAEVAGYIWARTRPWWGLGTLASQSTR
ncbi:hypothetical protein C8Q76DRAFT_714355, partial [Earliella scabrosa]